MAQFIIILILELVAVCALVLFDGVLDSKYYERKPIKGLSTEVYWTMALLALSTIFCVLHTYQETLDELALAITQLVFHVWLIFVLAKAYKAFSNLSLKYSLQYCFARFFLSLSITMEGLSLISLLFMAIRRYCGA